MIGNLNFTSFRSSQIQRSFLYRMNPSLKIIIATFLFVITFLPCSFIWQISLLLLFIALWIVGRLPFKDLFNIIITCVIMFLLMFFINWIAYKQPSVFFDISSQKSLLGCSWQELESVGTIKTIPGLPGHYWMHEDIWGGDVGTLTSVKPTSGLFIENLKLTIDKVDYNFYLPYRTTWYSLTPEVVIVTLNVTLKIFFMITIMTILTITTTSIQLAFGIDSILSPLKYLKIPISEWAMIITIAIRFVPSLVDEAGIIMKAQATRGVDFKNGNIIGKMQGMIALIIPMFSVAFKKANELSDAMEARNYIPQKPRTRYRYYSIHFFDWIFLFFITIVFFVTVMFIVWHVIFAPFFTIDCYVK